MNDQNIFFTDTDSTEFETVTAETSTTETTAAEPTVSKDTSSTEMVTDAPVLTVGAVDEGSNMVLSAVETAPVETVATTQAQLGFQPMNFVNNLRHMGVGMLTIFMIIGVIIVATMLINKIFSGKKDEE